MNTALSLNNLNFFYENHNPTKGYKLTDRELDILEFVLEMKFSTLVDIHARFFKVTKSGLVSNSLIWARQRILTLIKSEYLSEVDEICATPLYVLTEKGYFFLKNSRTSKKYCRPLFKIDGRFFDHDQKVSQTRIALESSQEAHSWISERQLSEDEELRKYLPTEFRPDAIYLTKTNEKVAFELEIARKSKERYRQKINRYIDIMNASEVRVFDKAHFICESEKVLKLISDQTQLFQPLFKFNLLSDYLK